MTGPTGPRKALGKVHLYTGDGKGKTTAALGLALRAAGAGLRTCIIQFAKPQRCSEHRAVEKYLGGQVRIRQFGGRGFVSRKPSTTHVAEAAKALRCAATALQSRRYDVVVLDEVCVAIHLNLLDCNDLIRELNGRRAGVEVIMTGRRAPRVLAEYADLVTELKEVKHYHSNGLRARQGIEY